MRDPFGKHDAELIDVPPSYDWFESGRLFGNAIPKDWPKEGVMLTPWGKTQWTTPSKKPALVFMSNMLCWKMVSGEWRQALAGPVTGGYYEPSFLSNESEPAIPIKRTAGERLFEVPPGRSFHFWPESGRQPTDGHDGLLVAFQARSVGAVDMLIGCGADYWRSATAEWKNHTGNAAIALGRMRRITPRWQWYAMTTV